MIQIAVPDVQSQMRPRITVFGVGGAGGNAVNNMIRSNLEGVEFVVANSDAQALAGNLAERKLQLGMNLTRGLGAGAKPEIGRASAEEQIDEIMAYLEGSNMVFITAGMGGGTGTGAGPVIARAAREQGILTVGVVTKPFHFEGAHRMRLAESGIAELQQYVDTLIVIPNQNLFRIANEKTTFADAFRLADEVLHSGVRGVTDLMVMPGLINLDFADIRSVMSEMGKAMMGTGEASDEKRSISAAEAAIANPLLDDVSMKGARGVLINITGGYDMTLFEVDEAANRIREEVDPDANIIFGSTFDEKMEGKMRVSVVATGIDIAEGEGSYRNPLAAQNTQHPRMAQPTHQPQHDSAAARTASFAPSFVAPQAAQQKSAEQPRPAQPHQQVSQTQPEQNSGHFGWGMRQPATPSSTQNNPSEALDNLIERVKAADAITKQAEASENQRQQKSASSYAGQNTGQSQGQQPPQQMSMAMQPSYTQTASVQPSPSQPQSFMPTAEPQQDSPEDKQGSRRNQSLFARIANFAQSGSKSDSAPSQGTAPQAKEGPKLGIDPANRPQLTSEEETLEIPAFLRRQSNS